MRHVLVRLLRQRPRAAWLGALLLVVAFGARTAQAGDGPESADPQGPTRSPAPAASTADFQFGAPSAWVSLRGARLFPRAGGDLFAFVRDQLTVERRDFRAAGFAADLGIVLAPSVDLVAGVDTNRVAAQSEYRHFVASNAQPIAQQTRLSQSALSIGVRVSPIGKGRTISRYAFIPRRIAPFAGAGVTAGHYEFSQIGQFVDFTSLKIFPDRFVSNGWSVGPYVHGGADVQVWKHLFLTFDGRYTWLHSGLDADFAGFNGIDLAGFRGGSGISVTF